MGEGTFSGSREAPQLAVKLHASDPQPLLDLQSVFGGVIYGPYTYGIRQFRVWVLRGWELEEALEHLDRWLPLSRKRQQYEAWKVRWAAYFARQRRIIPRDRPRFHRVRSSKNVKQ